MLNFELPPNQSEQPKMPEGKLDQDKEPLSLFELMTDKKLEFGTLVRVLRSNGQIEDGWIIRGVDGDKVIVERENPEGGMLEKDVLLDDLMSWNTRTKNSGQENLK